MDAVSLKGLERVISVTIGGDSAVDSDAAHKDVEHAVGGSKGKAVESLIASRPALTGGDYDEDKTLPVVHFRTYTVSFLRSGVPTPLVALSPHGPHLTFSLRRSQLPSAEMWKAAMKKTVKKVASTTKKNKNIDSWSFPIFSFVYSCNPTDYCLVLFLSRRNGRQGWTSLRRQARSWCSTESQVQRTEEKNCGRTCGRRRRRRLHWRSGRQSRFWRRR